MIKGFLNECFHNSVFLCVQKSFSQSNVLLPHYKSRFCSSCCITRFSPRTSIWDELTDERFNNKFVILYTKPMLQVTGYIIQTTYVSRIPSPTMFSLDHINRVKFLLFIFTWHLFYWFLSMFCNHHKKPQLNTLSKLDL